MSFQFASSHAQASEFDYCLILNLVLNTLSEILRLIDTKLLLRTNSILIMISHLQLLVALPLSYLNLQFSHSNDSIGISE